MQSYHKNRLLYGSNLIVVLFGRRQFLHILRVTLYSRQILMEGPLSMVDTGKPLEMFIILFDDMLLITKRKKALSKKVHFEHGGWSKAEKTETENIKGS